MRKYKVKLGLHLNANGTWMQTTHADESWGRIYGTFIHCSAFAEAANRSYINVLYTNSLWCTDSRWIAFNCSLNIRHTAECCLSRLGNTSTLNDGFVFACRIRVLFAFKCKPGFKKTEVRSWQWLTLLTSSQWEVV